MDELARKRIAERHNAFIPFGWDAGFARFFEDQAAMIGREHEMAAWPTQTDTSGGLQDPVTGQLYFVPGVSDPNGTDVFPP